MKLLVIGSKGFIGSSCVNHFRNSHEVLGCDIVPGNDTGYKQIHSIAEAEEILSSGVFDVCINASGSAHVGFSFENPERDRELNVVNVEAIANSIATVSPATRFINFSSAAVYGNPEKLPISESANLNPLSPYGMHKLESERVLRRFAAEKNLKSVSLRVFSAYGPGLRKQLFWDLFRKSQSGNVIRLFGTGKESRDFIFIDDLVYAVECVIANAGFNGESINVASSVETTIEEAATSFLSNLGNFELNFTGEEKAGDPKNWRADISLLSSLGFKPSVDIHEGLRRTANSYKKG
jgi:UDP-glucose 4-epimerase